MGMYWNSLSLEQMKGLKAKASSNLEKRREKGLVLAALSEKEVPLKDQKLHELNDIVDEMYDILKRFAISGGEEGSKKKAHHYLCGIYFHRKGFKKLRPKQLKTQEKGLKQK
ncbi:uncharacterized protein LOC131609738 [Vicia villosa]|uniref:uncharacterized protein LOC131609738 n=1 Tax=Vicia villosa TaxID=3911 RepID=UPI00273CD522|nr:uncharacterized protein LOC131609738 [Vicia villosa]